MNGHNKNPDFLENGLAVMEYIVGLLAVVAGTFAQTHVDQDVKIVNVVVRTCFFCFT